MIHIIFLLPAIYFLVGLLMRIYPPKKINYFVGYRTSSSMKNKKIGILLINIVLKL